MSGGADQRGWRDCIVSTYSSVMTYMELVQLVFRVPGERSSMERSLIVESVQYAVCTVHT